MTWDETAWERDAHPESRKDMGVGGEAPQTEGDHQCELVPKEFTSISNRRYILRPESIEKRLRVTHPGLPAVQAFSSQRGDGAPRHQRNDKP